ncbi:MAG: hypothetical protein JWN53_447, partial [Gemmatimonadetes bacterium]|nr:hypothetical protein [Gemmatimonadota bacterium]
MRLHLSPLVALLALVGCMEATGPQADVP